MLAIMKFKQLIAKFRKWQREPFTYSRDYSKSHLCNNCGETFECNYCPVCGQRAGTGRITWKSVWLGFMELWGLHTRSMPYSLWQLLLRPGYMIADYISGRRQVSFPPVKMLVIMGIITLIFDNWLDDTKQQIVVQMSDDTASVVAQQYVKAIYDWLSVHYHWTFLLLLSFLIWPTWVLFRYSPRCHHHTLPEGFFIQVFLSVQMLILVLLQTVLAAIFPNVRSIPGSTIYMLVIAWMIYRSYHQLFGYKAWGTMWRLIVAIVVAILQMTILIFVFACIVAAMTSNLKSQVGIPEFILVGLLTPIPFLLIIFALLGICNRINKRHIKKKRKMTGVTEMTETTPTYTEENQLVKTHPDTQRGKSEEEERGTKNRELEMDK